MPQLMRGIIAGLLMLGKTRVVEIMEGVDRALGAAPAQRRHDAAAGRGRSARRRDRRGRVLHGDAAGRPHRPVVHAGQRGELPALPRRSAADPARRGAGASGRPRPHSGHRAAVADGRVADAARRPSTSPPRCWIRSSVVRSDRAASPATPAAPPAKALDREIDPEFLELFIEEAKDEITKLKRLFPLWDENPQDQDSLVNVRRSFHTLKGSGRMVGAQLIGEFAWSVENLLNRVINKTLERSPEMMALLREAVAAVPELVEQLETARPPRANVTRIIEGLNDHCRRAPERACAASGRCAGSCAAAAQPPVLSHTQTTTVLPRRTASPQKKKRLPGPDVMQPTQMDPGLHEIYAKETAGHLATLLEFIAAAQNATPPYPVTEDLHRSCHTLSGTAKTAGARQGIKIAEPLNRYVRKLYDNSIGMSAAGLAVLKDASAAIQQVLEHLDENTGFFLDHPRIAARLGELEHQLDDEIARLAETIDATMQSPSPVTTAKAAAESAAEDAGVEVIEMEPTDANALSMLDWSYDNFPPAPAMADASSPSHDASPTIMRPAPMFRDDPTARAEALPDTEPTNVQQALEDGDPTNVQQALVEGDILASLTYEAPQEETAALSSRKVCPKKNRSRSKSTQPLSSSRSSRSPSQSSNPRSR